MKALAPLLLMACSAAPSELGSLSEPVYADIGYGQNHVSGYRCTLPFAGQRCDAPDSKDVPIYVDTTNCPAPFDQWVRDAVAQVSDWGAEHDWNMHQVSAASLLSNPATSVIGCSTSHASIVFAQTGYDYTGSNCSAAGPGTWCQYWRGRTITAFPWTLTHSAGWAGAAAWQREYVANNGLWHELMHALGLAHHPDLAAFDRLMHQGANLDNHTNSWWNELKYPASEEVQWLERYNPTSGTAPH